MVVLVNCKNEDPINNEGARVLTTLYINFSDAQGQITLELVVVSGGGGWGGGIWSDGERGLGWIFKSISAYYL